MIHTLRRAFSMIELIFVIIILGIVSSIGAEIIANVYEGYIIQRAQHRASIKTELVATQIANRLASAIPGTVVRRSAFTSAWTNINEPGNATDNILQWVGSDNDGFNTFASTSNRLPGWSGFCDVDNSSETSISTPGSNLGLVSTIKSNLGFTTTQQIYFPTQSGLINGAVSNISGTTISTAVLSTRVEHYKLASTSYALEATSTGDLRLYYDFDPTIGATPSNTRSSLLLRNVTVFKFRGDGRTIRFKLCVKESIGDSNIHICKEKAVF